MAFILSRVPNGKAAENFSSEFGLGVFIAALF
jgi:hypothetical protein